MNIVYQKYEFRIKQISEQTCILHVWLWIFHSLKVRACYSYEDLRHALFLSNLSGLTLLHRVIRGQKSWSYLIWIPIAKAASSYRHYRDNRAMNIPTMKDASRQLIMKLITPNNFWKHRSYRNLHTVRQTMNIISKSLGWKKYHQNRNVLSIFDFGISLVL